MKSLLFSAFVVAGCALLSGCVTAQNAAGDGKDVVITEAGDKIKVEINGKLFTEYNFKTAARPFFYPVIGPTGTGVTRNWPMKDKGVENEDQDHPHHCGVWFTHGKVNGFDFWANGKKTQIVHDKILALKSGRTGILKTSNKWIGPDGNTVCTDVRTHTFCAGADGNILDFEVVLHASDGDVVMGDTKEGCMAIRILPVLSVKGKGGRGHIVNNMGDSDAVAWSKKAEWCDYSGPLDGQIVGVSIFDHPSNPRHPAYWHAREYGLMAANHFGASHFEKKPAGSGDMKIPAGEKVTFRYRVYVHKGNEKDGEVAERYKEYAGK